MGQIRTTYRLAAALVAALLGLGSAGPANGAACGMAASPTTACGHAAQHCTPDAHSAAECVLAHHSNQEATPAVSDLDDSSDSSGALPAVRPHSHPTSTADVHVSSFRRPVVRAVRIHARVGVWIE